MLQRYCKSNTAFYGGVHAWMPACRFMVTQLTWVEDAVFILAGRFDVVVVDDNKSHFVSLIVDIVDGQICFGDCVRLYECPRVRCVVSVLHTYS